MHTRIQKLITFPGNGTRYRMCIHEQGNIVDTNVRYPGPIPGFGGLEGSVVQAIAEYLGVEFDYFVPDDDGFGVRLEDGTWTGCPGIMQKSETDVAMGAMLHNYWSNLFSYNTVSYRTDYCRFITKLPNPITKPDVMIKIFDIYLWIAILIFIMITTFASYWIHKRKYSIIDLCFSRVGELLLQEPAIKIEKVCSQELLCLFWNIGALFLALAYMAVILGTMMMPRRPPSLDTDEKLLEAVKAGKYKAAVDANLRIYIENLRQSPLSRYNQLADIIQENNWILPINVHTLSPLLKTDYAVTMAVASRKLYASPDIEIVVSKDYIYLANLCSLLANSFPLRKEFDKILTRLVEHGIYVKDLDLIIFKFRLQHHLNFAKDDEKIRALNLIDLEGAFMLLGVGYSIAIIVLIYEILKFKITERHKKPLFKNEPKESVTVSHNYDCEEIIEFNDSNEG